MSASKNTYTLRFETASDSRMTREEAMAIARSQNQTLRELIVSALVHERERLRAAALADDGPLTDEQIAWLRAQFPDSHFEGEEPLGPPLW